MSEYFIYNNIDKRMNTYTGKCVFFLFTEGACLFLKVVGVIVTTVHNLFFSELDEKALGL